MPKKLKVYVAMSGGVDSSVTATLLEKQGYDVTGVFFRPWLSEDGRAFCNWRGDKRDAMRVAAKLGIKFKVWDFSKEYGEKVTKYMINSYRKGITPNPDVMCNKEIKFGLFLRKALAEGANYIATGHYTRLGREIPNPKSQIPNKSKIVYSAEATSAAKAGRNSTNYKLQTTDPDSQKRIEDPRQSRDYKLLKGVDKNKDQSYFLWTLTQKQLKRCLFPVGDYTKPEVRKLAKRFGLHTHAKKDSQGVCFVGQLDVKEFLKGYIKPRRGKIKLLEAGRPARLAGRQAGKAGKVIGHHDGVFYYTIGQRHGLDIKTGGGPYFVVGKDVKKNIICITTDKRNLMANCAEVGKVNWINREPELPIKVGVKLRYRSKSVPAKIERSKKPGILIVKFEKSARAVAPGQSAVFYRGQEILGGGIVK